MIDYVSTSTASRNAGEDNDCAVKAVAIATGQTYDYVRGIMAAYGREPNAGTRHEITQATIEKLGFVLTNRPVTNTTGKTLQTVVKRCSPKKTYLITILDEMDDLPATHIFCVRDGRREDWRGSEKCTVTRIEIVELPQCRACGTRDQPTHIYYLPPTNWLTIPNWFRLYVSNSDGILKLFPRARERFAFTSNGRARLCEICAVCLWQLPVFAIPQTANSYMSDANPWEVTGRITLPTGEIQ